MLHGRGGSRIYEEVGVRFADYTSFFYKIETKLFHFHRVFKTGRRGIERTPSGSTMRVPGSTVSINVAVFSYFQTINDDSLH